MTTIKRLTGIARGGFEPMGVYGGIPTRWELGERKRTAPRGGGGGVAAGSVERGEIRTACTSFSVRGMIFQREELGGKQRVLSAVKSATRACRSPRCSFFGKRIALAIRSRSIATRETRLATCVKRSNRRKSDSTRWRSVYACRRKIIARGR